MQTMVVGFTHIILIHKLNMEEVRESRVKSTESNERVSDEYSGISQVQPRDWLCYFEVFYRNQDTFYEIKSTYFMSTSRMENHCVNWSFSLNGAFQLYCPYGLKLWGGFYLV